MWRSCVFLMLIIASVSLLAEKVVLSDATSVAINYFRQNVVPWQIKKGIVFDYDKAINLDSIKFEVDSLVDDQNVPVTYIFNFKPEGWMWVGATTSNDPVPTHSEEGCYSVKRHYDNIKKNISVNIYLDIFEAMKKRRQIEPDSDLKEQWNHYKIVPKEFEVQKNVVQGGIK